MNKTDLDNKNGSLVRKRVFAVLSVSVLFVLMLLFTLFLLRFFNQYRDPELFKQYINSFGGRGRFVLLGLQILQIIFAIIPGEFIEIGSGYAYGAFEGTFICYVGLFIGSAAVFLLTRVFGTRLTELFISREKIDSLWFMRTEQRLKRTIFLLYFIPGTPKDLLTYFAGLTNIKFYEFMLISLFARIPSVITSTVGGSAIGEKRYIFAIIVFAISALVSLAGIYIYKRILKKRQGNSNSK